jgi:hypothetical protein
MRLKCIFADLTTLHPSLSKDVTFVVRFAVMHSLTTTKSISLSRAMQEEESCIQE